MLPNWRKASHIWNRWMVTNTSIFTNNSWIDQHYLVKRKILILLFFKWRGGIWFEAILKTLSTNKRINLFSVKFNLFRKSQKIAPLLQLPTQSNQGWNIPKINDLVISLFLHYTTDFILLIFIDTCSKCIQFSKISSRSAIGDSN